MFIKRESSSLLSTMIQALIVTSECGTKLNGQGGNAQHLNILFGIWCRNMEPSHRKVGASRCGTYEWMKCNRRLFVSHYNHGARGLQLRDAIPQHKFASLIVQGGMLV